MGSYNFSSPADIKNGENLLVIKDRRIAVAYTVEALRIFDHYQFRVVEQTAKKAKTKLELHKPPRDPGRDRLVGGGLHRRQKDPRSGAFRVSSKGFPTDTKGGEFALDDLGRGLAGPSDGGTSHDVPGTVDDVPGRFTFMPVLNFWGDDDEGLRA